MPEDPVKILKKAAAKFGEDSKAATLVAPACRVVEICDDGDRVSKAVLKTATPSPKKAVLPPPTPVRAVPSRPVVDVAVFKRLEDEHAKLEKYLSVFAETFRKIESLEEKRQSEEKAVIAWLRELASIAGTDIGDAPSVTIDGTAAIAKAAELYFAKSVEARKTFERLDSDSSWRNLKIEEKKPAIERTRAELNTVQEPHVAMLGVLRNCGYEKPDGVVSKWEVFKKDALAVREAIMALPDADDNTASLVEWGKGLESATCLPNGYRAIDTKTAQAAARDLLKARAVEFSDSVAAADSVQPPFDKIEASSINVSSIFPAKLVIGRIDSFANRYANVMKQCDIPKTMPRCIDFPFAKPLIYENGDVLQMLVLRMAQALPQGLFEAYAIDSENVGQTFREIAGLRKTGILTVSSKNDDDERILSELETWLSDLSDRGCWDDSSDWTDYNRKHAEAPLPFKFLVVPSLSTLDSRQLSIIAKLAKNGPTAGIIVSFARQSLDSIEERGDEQIVKGLTGMGSQFFSVEALLDS